jgi:hypothetical protein
MRQQSSEPRGDLSGNQRKAGSGNGSQSFFGPRHLGRTAEVTTDARLIVYSKANCSHTVDRCSCSLFYLAKSRLSLSLVIGVARKLPYQGRTTHDCTGVTKMMMTHQHRRTFLHLHHITSRRSFANRIALHTTVVMLNLNTQQGRRSSTCQLAFFVPRSFCATPRSFCATPRHCSK